jgi:orotate phosphoribosyltransferase
VPDQLLETLRTKGMTTFDEPVLLASGNMSRFFLDGKRALAAGPDLRMACEAMAAVADEAGVSFDAAGGLTLGADQFAHGIALVRDCGWFVIRKQPKGRGTDRYVEGTPLGPGVKVLLVDDVVTTGGSIITAHERVLAEGAEVVLATTLVDRGGGAVAAFAELGVPYRPLYTHDDLGIPALGSE